MHGTALFPEIARVQHLGYTGIALGLRRFFQSALSLDSASENRDSTEIARDRAVATCVAAQISLVSLTHAGSRQNGPTLFSARARIAQCLMGGISMRKVTGSIPRGGEYFEKCPGTATIREEARKHFYLTVKADYCIIPLTVIKFWTSARCFLYRGSPTVVQLNPAHFFPGARLFCTGCSPLLHGATPSAAHALFLS